MFIIYLSILYNLLSILYNFQSILYNSCRLYKILILQFYRKRFFLEKKGLCGKMHTWQILFRHFSRKKGPCGKMHTQQNILKHFYRKKGPAGKGTHGKKIFYGFFLFSREKNYYVLPIFTSDN